MNFTTERLLINPLSENDAIFILELVNTEGWIKFIGNRNINSENDAIAYIRRINENRNLTYWTVRLIEIDIAVGIITLIKRDYLEHSDIGFAFLPNFSKKGFAFEATHKVYEELIQTNEYAKLLATTMPENINSIKLLEKIGFYFDRIIENDKVVLLLYKNFK